MPQIAAARVTHVTHEFAPHHVDGGLAIATSRLVAQLERAGASSRVLTSAGSSGHVPTPWGELQTLAVTGDWTERVASFIEQALEALAGSPPAADEALIVHESAALVSLARARRLPGRLVYWLHSLYDTPLPSELRSAWRSAIDPDSVLAGAIDAADQVVASAGILADAREVEWSGMSVVRAALLRAIERGATRTVEAWQCLPARELVPVEPTPLVRPRVVFPSRSGVHRGTGVFLAIADRLAHLDVEFVAIGDPTRARIDPARPGAARVRWIPWLPPAEFQALLASASCVVMPSLNEGFGLAAAEAAARGVPLIAHDIGGLRTLPTSAASFVVLTPSERARLYALWGALRLSPAHWPCWDAHAPQLAGLIERWVEQVEHALIDPCPAGLPQALGPQAAPSWGQALLDWIR